jgi:hypothetical protein
VVGGREAVHALDLDRRRAGPVDPRSHRGKEVHEVDDLGLARRVLDHGGAAGSHGRHQEVLGGTDARIVERGHGAAQPLRGGRLEEPVLAHERCSHPFQVSDVQVDRARTDVAATRHRHLGAAEPCEQGAQDEDRRAHPADELVRGLQPPDVAGVDPDIVAVPGDAGPEVLEHLGHREAVSDAGDVSKDGAPRRDQRGRHQLQG